MRSERTPAQRDAELHAFRRVDRCDLAGIVIVATAADAFESGVREVPLYDRATLGAGDRIDGPAIVTQLDATTLIAPGWSWLFLDNTATAEIAA